MSPLVKNTSNAAQCVSDLNLTFHRSNDDFGGDVHNVSDEQISGSLGMQTLLARGILVTMDPSALKEEALRRADLADKLNSQFDVPIVEESGEELTQNSDGSWTDPGAPVPLVDAQTDNVDTSFGGVALPTSTQTVRADPPGNPASAQMRTAAPVDLNKVTADESQLVDDIVSQT